MATPAGNDKDGTSGPSRRILVVFEKFPPFTVSGSWRPYFFVRHLPEFNYIADVISNAPAVDDVQDDALLDDLDPRCRLIRRRLWVTTVRQWFSRKTGTSEAPADVASANRGAQTAASARKSAERPYQETLRFRIYWAIVWRLYWCLDWAGPVVLSGLCAAIRTRYDAVWVSGPHSRNLFAGYWLARILRKPLVLDIRDPWTYGSLWTPKTPNVDHTERKWARRILRRADRIVFTSPFTMEEMQRRFPDVPKARMCTITNGFSETAIEPLRDAPADVCLFRYVGSLNDRRRPDVLLEGLQLARQSNADIAKDVRFEFIGGMAGHESKIASCGLDDVVRNVGRVSHRDSLRMIHGADVNVLLQTITEGQDVVSGKAFEYLASRKAILAVVSENGGDAWLVRETGAGVVASFEDVQAVANAIERCWRDWKSGSHELTISDERLARYSRRSLTQELVRVFEDVFNSRK